MKNKACSFFEVKSFDEEKREITGIASTITADRMGDVVVPKGAEYQLPIPLLWQHDHDQPIGHVTHAKVTDKGIEIIAKIAKGVTEDIDKAWAMIKSGLVRGLSIGFRPIDYDYDEKTNGYVFKRWAWYELSAVTVPANAEASIQLIKSIVDGGDTASGNKDTKNNQTKTAASGKKLTFTTLKKAGTKMDLIAQIKAFNDKRKSSVDEMETLMTKAAEEGRTLDAEESEKYDDLSAEVKSIDEHLTRLETQKSFEQQTATPVTETKSFEQSAQARQGVVVTEKRAEKGIAMAQVAKCLGRAQGNVFGAHKIAKSQKGSLDPRVERVLKAAMEAGSTNNSSWAGALVGDETSVYADFIEFLRPQTIIGKFGIDGVPSLRNVPFRVSLIGQTSGGEGYWTGEGKAKPLTKFDFERNMLEPLKVANIAVVTQEVLANASLAADALIRDQLVAALKERLDKDFIDPAKTAISGISPASVLNGITGIASVGNDADAIDQDTQALFGAFIVANNAPTSGVWVMSATIALALSMLKNPLGQKVYPEINMNGGVFVGLPVIVSQYVPTGTVALINADDIYLGDEGGFELAMSDQASLEMATDPKHDSTTPTATQLVSLWQTNCIGFRAERIINWKRRRESSVAFLKDVKWGSPATPTPNP